MTEYYGNPSASTRVYEVDDRPLAPALRLVDWLIILVISVLPVVNVIVLIIWALDTNGNPNRRSFSQAMLLLFGVELIIISLFIGYFAGWIYQVINMI